MTNKLYIGNIPYNLEEEDVESFFSEIGSVKSVKIIKDNVSGRSKGFGFVEMGSEEEASSAMDVLNGKELGGRNIVVKEAKPRE